MNMEADPACQKALKEATAEAAAVARALNVENSPLVVLLGDTKAPDVSDPSDVKLAFIAKMRSIAAAANILKPPAT